MSKPKVLTTHFSCVCINLPIYGQSYDSWENLSQFRLHSYSTQSFSTTHSLDWLMAWKIVLNSRSLKNEDAFNGQKIGARFNTDMKPSYKHLPNPQLSLYHACPIHRNIISGPAEYRCLPCVSASNQLQHYHGAHGMSSAVGVGWEGPTG